MSSKMAMSHSQFRRLVRDFRRMAKAEVTVTLQGSVISCCGQRHNIELLGEHYKAVGCGLVRIEHSETLSVFKLTLKSFTGQFST